MKAKVKMLHQSKKLIFAKKCFAVLWVLRVTLNGCSFVYVVLSFRLVTGARLSYELCKQNKDCLLPHHRNRYQGNNPSLRSIENVVHHLRPLCVRKGETTERNI